MKPQIIKQVKTIVLLTIMAAFPGLLMAQTDATTVAPAPSDTSQKPQLAERIYPEGYAKHRGDTSVFIGSVTPYGLQVYSSVNLEGTVSKHFSVGGTLTQTWKELTGTKVEMFGRYYPLAPAPNGLYVQAKFGIGSFKHDFNPTYIGPSETPVYDVKKFYGVFYSAGIGYQFIFGKKLNYVIDLSVSYQLTNLKKTDFIHTYNQVRPLTFQEAVIDHSDYLQKYGPAGNVLPVISFGYVFAK